MKHIGWCLEKIQISFKDMPQELTSIDSKNQAKKVIDEVQKYADTLGKIITHTEFEKLIHNLEHIHIEGITLHANHINELFKDLQHALKIIELTLGELRDLLNLEVMNKNDSIRWMRAYDKLVLMIDQKFGADQGELRKEFQITLHTTEQLKEIVKSEEHLAEFFK